MADAADRPGQRVGEVLSGKILIRKWRTGVVVMKIIVFSDSPLWVMVLESVGAIAASFLLMYAVVFCFFFVREVVEQRKIRRAKSNRVLNLTQKSPRH